MTGERPFSCPAIGCEMSFTTGSALKRHVTRSHVDILPFHCTKCDASFDGLRQLKRYVHNHGHFLSDDMLAMIHVSGIFISIRVYVLEKRH